MRRHDPVLTSLAPWISLNTAAWLHISLLSPDVDNFDIHKWNILILKTCIKLDLITRSSCSKEYYSNSFLRLKTSFVFKLFYYFTNVISASIFVETLFSFVSSRTVLVPMLSQILNFNNFVKYYIRSFSSRVNNPNVFLVCKPSKQKSVLLKYFHFISKPKRKT